MAMTVHCDIASSQESIFSGLAEFIACTGVMGELGITYGHAPLLTELKPGPLRIVMQSGEERIYYLSGGFLEVQPDVVSILADSALRADDIDEAAALEARKVAEHDLQNQSGEFDYSRASAQLAQASGQMRTIEELRKRVKSLK